MADLINFALTPLAPVTINNMPRVQISGTVVDSNNQSIVLGDFTGANAVIFPNVLINLSQADRLELMHMITGWLINKKFGV